jgi:hypothetical protein
MTIPNLPAIPPAASPDLSMEYLFRELDYQITIEAKARDRTENMMQYLVTSIAAILGAVLLFTGIKFTSVMLWLIISLLVLVVSISFFFRSCRLRYLTTYARVNRNKIRLELENLGISQASLLIGWEGNPSGFGKRMLDKLIMLVAFCSLLGSLTGLFSLLFWLGITEFPLSIPAGQTSVVIAVPILVAVLIASWLGIVLYKQKKNSDELITVRSWLSLKDYDL